MNHDRRAGELPAHVVLPLRAVARRWAEEIYNQMQDTMCEAMEDIRLAQGADMCHLVMRELESLELEATIASAAGPS